MTTYSSDKISAGSMKTLPLGYSQGILATCALPTTLALNDIAQMVKLEGNPSSVNNGPTITGISLGADALDSGNTLTLDVGDTTTAQKFIAASTIGQAGGKVSGTTISCLGYSPFASSYGTYTTVSLQTYLIQVKVHAAPTTAAAGNIRLLVDFNIDP